MIIEELPEIDRSTVDKEWRDLIMKVLAGTPLKH